MDIYTSLLVAYLSLSLFFFNVILAAFFLLFLQISFLQQVPTVELRSQRVAYHKLNKKHPTNTPIIKLIRDGKYQLLFVVLVFDTRNVIGRFISRKMEGPL